MINEDLNEVYAFMHRVIQ